MSSWGGRWSPWRRCWPAPWAQGGPRCPGGGQEAQGGREAGGEADGEAGGALQGEAAAGTGQKPFQDCKYKTINEIYNIMSHIYYLTKIIQG